MITYGDEDSDFPDKEMPKLGSNYICLVIILIGFVLKKDRNYYPQVFLKEYKCTGKEKKVTTYITDDLEISSDDSDKENLKKNNFKNDVFFEEANYK